MTITRRDFVKGAAGTGAAVAACAAIAPQPALARDNLPVPPKAVGLLFDSTLCIGCKACVAACKDANGMPAEFSSGETLWDTPLDISGKTLNVIKLYADGKAEVKDREKDGFAFVKKSCLHCVDPSCVSACPVSAMTKDPRNGIVGYDPDKCIGCRYCVAACPYGVPRFQYDTPTPRIQKCQLCKHRQAEGKLPACAEVCPTGATIFGTYPQIKAEAQRRRSFKAGEPVGYERRQLGSADIHEKPAPKYIDHVYGERELGGTQMMLMAGVPFEKLGLPKLPDRSYASTSETLQHTLYGGLIAPIIALGGLMAAAWRSTKNDHEQE